MRSRRWSNGRWHSTAQFEPRFLALPREVLLATLQAHQRYFAVQDRNGALLPRFITVSNIESPDPGVIRAGNERVVRPRLTDAAFFWDQDRRHPCVAYRAGLDSVSYQAALGSIGARVERIASLARSIGARIGPRVSTSTAPPSWPSAIC